MSRRRASARRAAGAMAVALVLGPVAPAFAEEPGARESAPPRVADGRPIEDVLVEDLLGLELSDQLGTTEAASRDAEPVMRAPATISVIDSEWIRRAAATSLPDLLRAIPGVQVYRTGPGNYAVMVRGTGGVAASSTIVAVDGVVLNSPLDGSVDWDLVPLHPADVERIEIVRGPVSTIYGANAYTGVINVVSRAPLAYSPSYALRSHGGSDRTIGLTTGVSGRYMHHEGATLAALYGQVGYDSTAAADDQADQAALGNASLLGRVQHGLGENLTLSSEAAVSVSRRSAVDHLMLEPAPLPRALGLASARLRASGLPGILDEAAVWVQDTVHVTEASDAAMGFSYGGTRANRLAGGADVTISPIPRLSATASASAHLDWVRAPYVHPNENDQVRPGYGLAGRLSARPVDALDLRAEVRGDSSPMTGRFELSYRGAAVLAQPRWGLRLSAGSAYRSPSYVEVGGRFVDPASMLILLEGTPTIDSPRHDAIELGVSASPSYDLVLSSSVYYGRLRHVIVEDFEPLVRKTFRNDDQARTLAGIEAAASWRIRRWLSSELSASFLEFLDASDTIATIAVPEQNAHFTASAHLRGTTAGERMHFGAGVDIATSRRYALVAGIPPVIIDHEVPTTALASGMVGYRATASKPLWVSLRVRTTLPDRVVESPFPGAAPLGSIAMVEVEYRTE